MCSASKVDMDIQKIFKVLANNYFMRFLFIRLRKLSVPIHLMLKQHQLSEKCLLIFDAGSLIYAKSIEVDCGFVQNRDISAETPTANAFRNCCDFSFKWPGVFLFKGLKAASDRAEMSQGLKKFFCTERNHIPFLLNK